VSIDQTGGTEDDAKRERHKDYAAGGQAKRDVNQDVSGTGNRTLSWSVRATDVSHYTIPDELC
jgi:hypothetical protein